MSYQKMHIESNQVVLDVGCGIGSDLARLAEATAPNGKVIGLDLDKKVVAEARRRFEKKSSEGCLIQLMISNGYCLPIKSNTCDSLRCERVLQNVTRPSLILSELVRVSRSGGQIVVMDTDWNTLSLDAPNKFLWKRIKDFFVSGFLKSEFQACELYRMFLHEGLEDVAIESFPLLIHDRKLASELFLLQEVEEKAVLMGVLTEDERQVWTKDFWGQKSFYGSVNMIIASGRKPSDCPCN